jgi:hypothetical protein
MFVLFAVEGGNNFGPLLALFEHLLQEGDVLLWFPFALDFVGVQPIQPPLTALLGIPEVFLVALGEELF